MERKYLFIILGVILLIVLYFSLKKDKEYAEFKFPSTLRVNNYTNHHMIDTISSVILYKIFKYDSLTLNIYYISGAFSNHKYDIVGYIDKSLFVENTYNMFVSKRFSGVSMKRFLAHELTHLKQLHENRLIPIDNTSLIYMGDTIYFSEVPYEKRLYEIDARNNERVILRELNELLYIKQ